MANKYVFISYSITPWFSTWYVRQKLMLALSQHSKVVYTNPRMEARDCINRLLSFHIGLGIKKINRNLIVVAPPWFIPRIYRWPVLECLLAKCYSWYLLIIRMIFAFHSRPVHYIWEPFAHWPNHREIKDLWIYHPYDFFRGYLFNRKPDEKTSAEGSDRNCEKGEEILVSQAGLFYAVSEMLCGYYSKTYGRTPALIENGVGDNYFSLDDGRLREKALALLKGVPRRWVAYSGSIKGALNLDIVTEAAKGLKEMAFIFIGPIRKTNFDTFDSKLDRLLAIDNVYYLGEFEADLLPYLLSQMDALLLCYSTDSADKNLWTNYSGPAKLFEYMALGKPIFSTFHPVTEKYNKYVTIVDNATELIHGLRHMDELFPTQRLEEGVLLARSRRWSLISERILEDIERLHDPLADRTCKRHKTG